MVRYRIIVGLTLVVVSIAGPPQRATAQGGWVTGQPSGAHVVIPQARAFHGTNVTPLTVTQVTVGVVIQEQVATTTMDVHVRNSSAFRTNAELVIPVPDGSVVRSFSFQGSTAEPDAQVLSADEARRAYDALVARLKDPALLEFIGYNLIRSSVFPVESRGTQIVRVTYEHLLTADGDRIDYVLPRSESLDYSVPWTISIRIKSSRPISTTYSPTHDLETVRLGSTVMSVKVGQKAAAEPGPFHLSYLLAEDGITASLLAYPDPTMGGGYFLLLGGLPPSHPNDDRASAIKRDVTLVVDRSGSMAGAKLEQAREAARQVLAGLEPGETFNIVSYDNSVDVFSKKPLDFAGPNIRAAYDYLARMKAQGCTNLHDALKETFLLPASDDRLPVVLFLTDGLPTVGQTSETAIRDLAVTINRHGRRVFTFGVGADVNVPLLDKIAADTRGESTYVLPGESVEEKVAKVFKQLSGPVLADVQFDAASQDGFTLVSDLQPKVLPDLYDGNQFVVLGKYRGDGPLRFRLAGNFRGRPRAFTFAFGLDKATTRNSFVPRLWASRRIGSLVEAVRQLGADIGIGNAGAGASNDPRVKELVDEIVRLGTEFGILTEYTAFLAREGTDLSDRDRVHTEANSNLVRRAINTRSGIAAVNQSANSSQMQRQQRVNRGNVRWTETMDRVSTANVQQVNDLTFYHRHGRWVDSRVVDRDTENEPTRVVEFGTPAFDELAHQLARQSRQGSMLLRGEIVMVVNGELVLIRGPAETSDQAKGKGRPRSR